MYFDLDIFYNIVQFLWVAFLNMIEAPLPKVFSRHPFSYVIPTARLCTNSFTSVLGEGRRN